MAGKRHHIIPRFLQKGFASRIVKNKKSEIVFTWRYMKNVVLPETDFSTKDTIVSEHFYGKEGEINADDEITKVENDKFSPLIDKLREGSCNTNESKTEIAELIAHLSVRTKVVRKGIEQMSERTFEGIKEVLTDNEISSDLISRASKEDIAGIFDEALNTSSPEMDSALAMFQLFGLGKENVKDLTTDLIISNQQNEETKEETQSFVRDLFSKIFDGIIEDLPESIRKGHNQSLLNNTIPLPRVEKYEQLNWIIYEVTSSLILGDIACVFRELGKKSFKTSCELDKTGQVYLPISDKQILIGMVDTEEVETNVKVLNEAMARCSYEQFISSEKSDEKIDLIEFIGLDSQIVSDEEIMRELDEIRNNLGRMYKDK